MNNFYKECLETGTYIPVSDRKALESLVASGEKLRNTQYILDTEEGFRDWFLDVLAYKEAFKRVNG